MAIHIYVHDSAVKKPAKKVSKDSVAPAKVKAHPQFTQGDYDYLKTKGWSDSEILKRWDEEKAKGVAPNKVNKLAKVGQAGFASAKDISPFQVEKIKKDIANEERLLKARGETNSTRLKFLKEELEKAELRTDDAGAFTESVEESQFDRLKVGETRSWKGQQVKVTAKNKTLPVKNSKGEMIPVKYNVSFEPI